MKIILSRKGFDTGNAAKPSAILPNGDMVSLPIPYRHAPTSFSQVRSAGLSIGQLVEDLTRNQIQSTDLCHLDPDLRRESLRRRHQDWRPAFGQQGNEQKFLSSQEVGRGDLFLFFGTFKRIEKTNSGWRYVVGTPKVHAFFGWLQVEDTLAVTSANAVWAEYPWLRQHPHTHDLNSWKNNVIYTSREHLRICEQTTRMRGAGTFQFSDDLVLTSPCERTPSGRCSIWGAFPWCGRQRRLRFANNLNRQFEVENRAIWTSFGNYQEIVIDSHDYPEILPWCRDLIRSNAQH